MKKLLVCLVVFCFAVACFAQKHVYEVVLFGKKIGETVVERTDKGNGEIHYRLISASEANVLFTKKTSYMDYRVVYKDGKLISSYVKNVKDGVTEIVTITWQGTQYLIKKGTEELKQTTAINYSSIFLYFTEPINMTRIFSERLAAYCTFTKNTTGEYECKLDNGVSNIYRYRNGVLYELEMSKGASVFMRLVK